MNRNKNTIRKLGAVLRVPPPRWEVDYQYPGGTVVHTLRVRAEDGAEAQAKARRYAYTDPMGPPVLLLRVERVTDKRGPKP